MSVAWVASITDTHAYDLQDEDCLTKICAWISANKTKRNIVAVMHRGDLAHNGGDSAVEWSRIAASGFPVSGIPNIWLPGNHDSNNIANRVYTKYDVELPSSLMTSLTGEMYAGSSRDTYHLIDIGGTQWLILALEFNPSDLQVAWAGGVLDLYPTTPTIVLTHSALYSDGTLSEAGKIPAQNYVYTGFPGGDNYGKQLWDKILEGHGAVALTLSGHDILNVHAYLATARSPSAMFPYCHHVLRNFQSYDTPNHGNPFITMIGFDYAENKLYFEEFSPPNLLDMYLPAACMTVDLVKTTA